MPTNSHNTQAERPQPEHTGNRGTLYEKIGDNTIASVYLFQGYADQWRED